jgi:two-component system, NtrC family, nitrogen regulation response regulator GlnG
LLLEHYLRKAADELAVPAKTLSPEVLACLVALRLAGNVRQLVNTCRRLTVVAPGREIRLTDLPAEITGETGEPRAGSWTDAPRRTGRNGGWTRAKSRCWPWRWPSLERTLIRVAMARSGGHRQEAARLLGWGRNTLARKIRELGLEG